MHAGYLAGSKFSLSSSNNYYDNGVCLEHRMYWGGVAEVTRKKAFGARLLFQ